MEIRACYESIGADFDAVLSRLGNEEMVQRFAVRFLEDTSYRDLERALQEGDVETAFRAAHTLKGVCGNLGFDNLYAVSVALTDKLREKTLDGSEALFEKVKEQYRITTDALRTV